MRVLAIQWRHGLYPKIFRFGNYDPGIHLFSARIIVEHSEYGNYAQNSKYCSNIGNSRTPSHPLICYIIIRQHISTIYVCGGDARHYREERTENLTDCMTCCNRLDELEHSKTPNMAKRRNDTYVELKDIVQHESRKMREKRSDFDLIEAESLTIEMEKDFWDARQFQQCARYQCSVLC